MRERHRIHLHAKAVVAASLLVLAACASGPREVRFKEGEAAQVTADGLHRIKARGANNQLFVKPGADLGVFTEVMLEPVRIRYAQTSGRHLDERGMQLAEDAFRDVFVRELARSEVFTLVEAPGPQVLRIAPQITDLDVTAPPSPGPGRSSMIVNQAGVMTLLLDISDSRTRAPLVRAASRRAVRNFSPGAQNTTSNLADLRILFRQWARLLREWLDEVREIPPLPAEEPPEA